MSFVYAISFVGSARFPIARLSCNAGRFYAQALDKLSHVIEAVFLAGAGDAGRGTRRRVRRLTVGTALQAYEAGRLRVPHAPFEGNAWGCPHRRRCPSASRVHYLERICPVGRTRIGVRGISPHQPPGFGAFPAACADVATRTRPLGWPVSRNLSTIFEAAAAHDADRASRPFAPPVSHRIPPSCRARTKPRTEGTAARAFR